MMMYSLLLLAFCVGYVVGVDRFPFIEDTTYDSPQISLEERTKSMKYSEEDFKHKGEFRIGDALLSKEQEEKLFREDASFAIINDKKLRWTNAIIPYELDCSIANLGNAVKAIKAAMKQWERKTCIRFVEKKPEHKMYLRFIRDTHCWGHVGMNSAYTSTISCGFGCEQENVMAHEIGHTVGFYHEQNRKDRDRWVNVHWNEIGKFKSAFEIVKNVISMQQQYDYESIMHYPWNAFSATGKNTMSPKYPGSKVPYVEISKGDITQTRLMYNCDQIERQRSQSSPEYTAQDEDSVFRMRSRACRDTNRWCKSWASSGYCRTNARVKEMCKKSCNLCTTTRASWSSWGSYSTCTKSCGGGSQTRTRSCSGGSDCPGSSSETRVCGSNACPVGDCKENKGKYCTYWGRKGYCETKSKFYGYMMQHCCLACKELVPPPPTVKPDGKCLDREPFCSVWKDRGYCQRTKVYMDLYCCKTCNGGPEPPTPDKKTPKPPVEKKTKAPTEKPVVTEGPVTPTGERITLGTGVLCTDTRTDCSTYAQRGECTRNPGWMEYYCKATCKSFCPTCGFECDNAGLRPKGSCNVALGLSYTGKNARPKIPDRSIFLGSGVGYLSTGGWNAFAKNARLYFPDDRATKSIGAWCARFSDLEAKKPLSLIVDLGARKTIAFIATQGRDKYFERISEFKIEYSDSRNYGYKPYMEGGKAKVFTGSCDYRTPVVNQFSPRITARYMKYIPVTWNYPCVRLEYYGC